MLKWQWTRIWFVVIRGLLLTILAVILQSRGYLDRLEFLLLDERVIHCQVYRPRPTPSLVHLDVDDDALAYIGHWPWPPVKMAKIVDEIALAKPKLLATDVLYLERNDPVYGKNDSVGVDGDQVLADSIARLGCALIPVSLQFDAPSASAVHHVVLDFLIDNPECSEAECLGKLRSKGITEQDLKAHSDDSFLRIREQAVFERIWREVTARKGPASDKRAIRLAVLPHADPLTKSVLGDLFDEQYDLVMRQKSMLRFTLPIPSGALPLLRGTDERAPILPLANAAAYSGFADYLPEKIEGTVREIPLVARYRDRLVLQLDLVTACAALGVNIQDIRLSSDFVTLPLPGGKEVRIPVSTRYAPGLGTVGMRMEVPMFGRPDDWATMYDFPSYREAVAHVSAYEVWIICETTEKLADNESQTDTNIETVLNVLPYGDLVTKYFDAKPGEQRMQIARQILDLTPQYVQSITMHPELFPAASKALPDVKSAQVKLQTELDENDKLEAQRTALRKSLYDKLHGRTIYFGGTATSLPDVRRTSLISQCPGVVVHGAIYNAIMTGKMPRQAQQYMGWLVTAAIGLLTMLLVLALPPSLAFGGSLALALGYMAFNGYFLFDRENLIVEAAGPLTAILLVWSGLTLTNIMTEIAERTRITRRFSTYVDPEVVNYVVAHPESTRFDGERREMTVGFSDLASFTTLTDELGERIIPLLAEYLGKMVPVIRSHKGHVAQLSGDGIYFYFGAPGHDEQHAEHAVTTALEMHKALELLNFTLIERGSKPLGMRIGISTGEVIVGDAGTADVAAYTAMGATTNLASRLESANKVFGTRTLVTARTVELLNGDYLLRPVANLRVAGKLNNAMVYEPICRISEATEQDRLLVQWTGRIFQVYCEGDFEACIAAAEQMRQMCGASTLTSLYTRMAIEHRDGIAEVEHCQGQIVLTEK